MSVSDFRKVGLQLISVVPGLLAETVPLGSEC